MGDVFVDVPGGRLYCTESGSGEPLVLGHAGIADSRMWDDQVRQFSRSYRVVRYDIRGFGRSTDPAGDFRHYDDLRALLDYLDIAEAHLLGVSMAGSIVIDFALAHPERVRSLVLVATGPNGYDRWGEEVRAGWGEEEAAIEAGDMEQAIEVNIRMWVDGPGRTSDEVREGVRERVREMLALNLPREGAGEARDLQPLAAGRLAEIQAPTLVIVGGRDQRDIIESSRMLARQIAGARLEEMRGVAHLPNMEQPEEFNRLVLEFLRAI